MSLAISVLLTAVLATATEVQRSEPEKPEAIIVPLAAQPPAVHRFWDWQNAALFSGVAAARAFDYFSTRKFRRKHLKEWFLDDRTVDNKPIFISIEVAGTAASIAASYVLHRTGHHRLERWASIIHIGVATAGSIWNCTLPNGL